MSQILESVLQTVQTQFTYGQYILTDLYRRQCAEYTYIYSIHSVLLRHIYNYQYTFNIMYTYIHNDMRRCNRLYISGYAMCIVWYPVVSLGLSLYTAWCRYPGGREAHLQQCGGQFARPFAEPCGCQRCCFHTRRWYSRSGCSPQCRCRRTWGFWGSFQTSSAVSGRRDADVPSSALHLCEQTMWDPRWCERRGT